MVSPIGNTDAIRALATLIQRSIARGTKSRTEKRQRDTKAHARRTDTILREVVQRARAIPPDHPDRERMAMQLFVEGVLLAELGDRLALEPGFQTMVRDVEEAMRSTPALQADLRRVVDSLLS